MEQLKQDVTIAQRAVLDHIPSLEEDNWVDYFWIENLMRVEASRIIFDRWENENALE